MEVEYVSKDESGVLLTELAKFLYNKFIPKIKHRHSLKFYIVIGNTVYFYFRYFVGVGKHIFLKSSGTFVYYTFMLIEVLIFFLLTCGKILCVRNIIFFLPCFS